MERPGEKQDTRAELQGDFCDHGWAFPVGGAGGEGWGGPGQLSVSPANTPFSIPHTHPPRQSHLPRLTFLTVIEF